MTCYEVLKSQSHLIENITAIQQKNDEIFHETCFENINESEDVFWWYINQLNIALKLIFYMSILIDRKLQKLNLNFKLLNIKIIFYWKFN